MSDTTKGASADDAARDQAAIDATQGLGLKGIGQPKPNELVNFVLTLSLSSTQKD